MLLPSHHPPPFRSHTLPPTHLPPPSLKTLTALPTSFKALVRRRGRVVKALDSKSSGLARAGSSPAVVVTAFFFFIFWLRYFLHMPSPPTTHPPPAGGGGERRREGATQTKLKRLPPLPTSRFGRRKEGEGTQRLDCWEFLGGGWDMTLGVDASPPCCTFELNPPQDRPDQILVAEARRPPSPLLQCRRPKEVFSPHAIDCRSPFSARSHLNMVQRGSGDEWVGEKAPHQPTPPRHPIGLRLRKTNFTLPPPPSCDDPSNRHIRRMHFPTRTQSAA
jgi:hypothetical protein